MGKSDESKYGVIAQSSKALLPYWKTAGPMTKILIVFAVVLVVVLVLKPWKQEEPTSRQEATQSGNGNSLNQAGRDNNIGVPATVVQQIVNLKEIELTERQMAEYPHGSILFGLQNGKVIYDTRLKDVTFNADWDNATLSIKGDSAKLYIPHVTIDSPNRIHMEVNIVWDFQFEPGKASMYPGIVLHNLTMWCEVLDAQRGIFRIGFK